MWHSAAPMLLRWARQALLPNHTCPGSSTMVHSSLHQHHWSRASQQHATCSTVSSPSRLHSSPFVFRALAHAQGITSSRQAPSNHPGALAGLQVCHLAARTACTLGQRVPEFRHSRVADRLCCRALHLEAESAPRLQVSALNEAPWPQQAQQTRVVLIAVDPDTHGAVAVASWVTDDLTRTVDVRSLQMELYDMPCQEVLLKKKSSVTGKQAKRTWLDVQAVCQLVQQVLHKHTGPGHSPHMQQPCSCPPSSNGTSPEGTAMNGTGPSGAGTKGRGASKKEGIHRAQSHDCSHSQGNGSGLGMHIELRAVVESSPTLPFTSRPSTIAPQLHSVGAWHGILAMAGFKTSTVPASTWKHDMSLMGLEKEGSLALAKQLWPDKYDMLARKKDHGRAEALLIAAWAMGATRPPPPGLSISLSALRGRLRPRQPPAPSPTAGTGSGASAGTGASSKANAQGSGMSMEVARSIVFARAGLDGVQQDLPVAGHGDLDTAASASHDQHTPEGDGWSPLANWDRDHEEQPPHPLPDEPKPDLSSAPSSGTNGSTSSTRGSAGTSQLIKVTFGEEEGEGDGQKGGAGRASSGTSAVDKEQLRQLIEERNGWEVVMGPLRSLTATDGYGNALPQVLQNALVPVEPRRRLVLPSPAPHMESARKLPLNRRSRAVSQPTSVVSSVTVSLAPAPIPIKPEKRKRVGTVAEIALSAGNAVEQHMVCAAASVELTAVVPAAGGKGSRSKKASGALLDEQHSALSMQPDEPVGVVSGSRVASKSTKKAKR